MTNKIRISSLIMVIATVIAGAVACSEDVPKLQLKPTSVTDRIVTDNNIQTLEPKIDILFVIDNSASMYTHQQNISNNIAGFIRGVSSLAMDFHMGVISTDMEGMWAAEQCCGKLIGNIKYVTPKTPNLTQVLQQNIMIGTDGAGTEMMFDPIFSALTNPNLGGVNKGFYRPDAHIAVIFITDAEDQSRLKDQNAIYSFLTDLKKGTRARVFANGVIIPTNERNCVRDDPTGFPYRIEDFLGKVANAGKNILSLCAPDFGQRLADFGSDLAAMAADTIYLSRIPDPATIEVKFGTVLIPNHPLKGWTYDPSQNSLHFGRDVDWGTTQPAGTKITVTFAARKW